MPLKPFGIRAMNSLRLEKSYRLVVTELSIEYAALESGLQRFVHPGRGEFLGREALLASQQRGFAFQFVTLEVHDVKDADALGNNPIGFAQGGQESWNAVNHYDVVLPSAGGGNAVPGDYLFRDAAAFGNASGLWGILRVQ